MVKDKLLSDLKNYFRDRLILSGLVLSLTCAGGLGWWLYSKFHNQTDFVPLHYNIFFGIDLYGPWYQIMILPLTGLVFFFINFIASYIIYRRAKLLSHFLILFLLVSELILTWAGWLIVRVLIV